MLDYIGEGGQWPLARLVPTPLRLIIYYTIPHVNDSVP
jgi:hypothetical protein